MGHSKGQAELLGAAAGIGRGVSRCCKVRQGHASALLLPRLSVCMVHPAFLTWPPHLPPLAPSPLAHPLCAGARSHLERGHATHTRNMLLRHKLQAERGADPEQLREVQAYIQVKYASRGPMDFRQPGGHDTAWIQVGRGIAGGRGVKVWLV